MSINEVLARMGEIRARMDLAPMRPSGAPAMAPATAPSAAGAAPADFASTLASVTAGVNGTNNVPVTNQAPGAPAPPIPGAGYLSTDGDLGRRMASFAVQYLGTPYVAGGNTPQTGWDCAAFTEWVAKQHGIEIPPVSWEQIKVGEPVANLGEARPGDLVFFHEPAGHSRDPSPLKVNHVGIYLGDGRMVDAANPSADTRITQIDVSKVVGIRRLAEAPLV